MYPSYADHINRCLVGTESHRDSRNKELVRSLELQHEISNHQGRRVINSTASFY
jgi:hypothetical protein